MSKYLQTLTRWLSDVAGLTPAAQSRLFATVVLVLVLWGLRRLVLTFVYRRTKDHKTRYRWQKTTSYVVVPIGVLLVGRVWFEGFGSLATFLGLASAGVAIALKDILVNLAAWAFILVRRPFEVGDRVEIGKLKGDVIDLRLFQFTLMEVGNWVDAEQSTGRVLHVPNGIVLTEATANYSQGFQYIWNELPVLVTFESDWKKAKQLLTTVVEEHAGHLSEAAEEHVRALARKYMISYTHLTPIVWTKVADSGVLLTMRYLVEPQRRRSSEQEVWENVLDVFAQHPDIDFAYPTQRFYDNRLEGKSGAGGPKA